MGFDSPDEEHALPASEGGSGYPARLCAAFLKRASDRLSAEPFPRPKTVKTVLLDSIDLQTRHVARLSTELTPADAVAEELFHREDAPQVFSDNWTAPSAV